MSAGDEFLDALSRGIEEEERLIICGFAGSPDDVDFSAWKPRPWRPGRDLLHDCGILPNFNAYVTVSAFGRCPDNSFRRRAEAFKAGLALMIDDVGVGKGSKVNPDIVRSVPPSAIVETSPGNFQWWYFLDQPCRDVGRYDGVIRAFISGKLLGADPGMAGVARVARIPGYINGKAKYGGNFRVALHALTDLRYSVEDLLAAFDLKINGCRRSIVKLTSEEAIERNRAFLVYFKWMRERRMIKSAQADMSGWWQAVCPWTENHTGGVDNGFAIREPSDENNYFGAAKCHHGACIDKGWSDLTEWIAEISEEELNATSIEYDNGFEV